MTEAWEPVDLRAVTDPGQLRIQLAAAAASFVAHFKDNKHVRYQIPNANQDYCLNNQLYFSYSDIARATYQVHHRSMRVSSGAQSTALASQFPKGVYATEVAPHDTTRMSQRSCRLGFLGTEWGVPGINVPERIMRDVIRVDHWVAVMLTTGFRERGSLTVPGSNVVFKHFCLLTPHLGGGEFLVNFEIVAWGVTLLPEELH